VKKVTGPKVPHGFGSTKKRPRAITKTAPTPGDGGRQKEKKNDLRSRGPSGYCKSAPHHTGAAVTKAKGTKNSRPIQKNQKKPPASMTISSHEIAQEPKGRRSYIPENPETWVRQGSGQGSTRNVWLRKMLKEKVGTSRGQRGKRAGHPSLTKKTKGRKGADEKRRRTP